MFKHQRGLWLLLSLLMVVVAGCGDDDGGSTDPGNNAMTESAAIGQASAIAAMIVADIATMDDIALGVSGKDLGYDLDWDEAHQHWVATVTGQEEGFTVDYTVTVQYRDATGTPVLDADRAASFRYTEVGTFDFDYSDEDVSIVTHLEINEDVTVTGVQTETLTINSDSTVGLDYDVTTADYSESVDVTVGWETIPGGLSLPIDGCPTGTVRVTMAPFHLDLVFDGNDTASYTLYNASGGSIPEGSGVESLVCGI